MTPLVLKARISKRAWEKLVKKLDKRTEVEIKTIHYMLENLHANEWKAVNDVYTMTNSLPASWENMHLFFDSDVLPEQELLTAALRRLRSKWLNYDGTEEDHKEPPGSEDSARDSAIPESTPVGGQEHARQHLPGGLP